MPTTYYVFNKDLLNEFTATRRTTNELIKITKTEEEAEWDGDRQI